MEKLYKTYQKQYYAFDLKVRQMRSFEMAGILDFKETLLVEGVYDIYSFVMYSLIGYHLRAKQFDIADTLMAEIKKVSDERSGYPSVYYHFLLGLYEGYKTGDFSVVIKHYDDAEKKLKLLLKPDPLAIFEVFHLKGIALYRIGEVAGAYKSFTSALKSFLPKDVIYRKSVTYNWLGIIEDYLSNSKQALFYLKKSAELQKKFKLNTYYCDTLNSIGLLYLNIQNYDEAQKYITESLNLAKECKLPQIEADAYNNLGIYYRRKKEPIKALECYQNCLAIRSQSKTDLKYAFTISNIGNIYLDMNNLTQAEKYIKQGFELSQTLPDNNFKSKTHIHYADLYIAQKDFTNALWYLNEAEKIARETLSKPTLLLVYETYIKLYSAQEQYKQALEYSQLYNVTQKEVYESRLAQRMGGGV